jgi:hypothetical protein
MSAAAIDSTTRSSARIERFRRAVKAGRVVVSAEPLALLRARRRGRLTIDARRVAAALMAAEPEFFGPSAGDL